MIAVSNEARDVGRTTKEEDGPTLKSITDKLNTQELLTILDGDGKHLAEIIVTRSDVTIYSLIDMARRPGIAKIWGRVHHRENDCRSTLWTQGMIECRFMPLSHIERVKVMVYICYTYTANECNVVFPLIEEWLETEAVGTDLLPRPRISIPMDTDLLKALLSGLEKCA